MNKTTNCHHASVSNLCKTAKSRRWSSFALTSCVAWVGAASLAAIGCSDDGATGNSSSSGGAFTAVNSVNAAGTTLSNGSAGSTASAGAGGSANNPTSGGVMEGTGGMALDDNGEGGNSNSGSAGAQLGDAGAPGGRAIPAPDCGVAANPQVPNLQLTPFITGGLSGPLLLVPERLAPDATEGPEQTRLYVVEQGGNIRLIVDGQLEQTPFLQIGGRVETQGNEQGLLGLALHPDFQSNGLFYVNYSADGSGDTVVSEFSVDVSGGVVSNTANQGSERILLTIEQPQGNHNGGNITFGPDGFLYIGMGDGGSGNDPHGPIGNGQNIDVLLGKILRIDVNVPDNSNQDYAIPADNPFVNADGADEIWSLGIRNPWRFTFDACTDDMYIGDVGQNALEEIDFEPAGLGGRNYGWRCAEGDQTTGNACNGVDQSVFIEPVATHERGIAQSITGGYVYRGSAIPDLRGTYLYADYVSAEFFALRMDNGQLVNGSTVTITDNINSGNVPFIASFGEDNSGEMYVISLNGSIYRIEAAN